MSFLLDTDTCSVHLKRPDALAIRFLQYLGRLQVSIITVGELLTWCKRALAARHRSVAVNELLADIRTIGIDHTTAEIYAGLRATQLDEGRPRPIADLWIAATALAHDLTLVTHNTKDFEGIPGLRIEDWLE